MSVKPMLAATVERFEDLHFPLIGTPKYDGIRALVINGVVMSRKLIAIPNVHVQQRFGSMEGFDGELLIGDPCDPMCFRRSTSVIGSRDKDASEVDFMTFDTFTDPKSPYQVRSEGTLAPQQPLNSIEEVIEYEEAMVSVGWEGIILRCPKAAYKFGRSTMREHGLMKYKRFFDDEAEVVGFEPRYKNTNELKEDALGHAKRSSAKAGKVPLEMMGALKTKYKGEDLSVGMFGTEADAKYWWEHRDEVVGKVLKFKYQKTAGKPRFPVGLGFRED